jgi:hypothetical protein
VVERDGVSLLVDPMSYQYLVGATIEYQEGLQGSQFVVQQPECQFLNLRLRQLVLDLTQSPTGHNQTRYRDTVKESHWLSFFCGWAAATGTGQAWWIAPRMRGPRCAGDLTAQVTRLAWPGSGGPARRRPTGSTH